MESLNGIPQNNIHEDMKKTIDCNDVLVGNGSCVIDRNATHDRKSQKHAGALQQLSTLLGQTMKLDSVIDMKGNLPTIPINDLRGEEASLYYREESILRRSLAALYRLIDIRGWTQSIYNHISARCSTNPSHFLINPFGLLYHEIQASSLVKIDHSGNVVEHGSSILGTNKAAWVLHSALHFARKDVNCVIHVHLPDVIAVSCLRAGLLPVSVEAVELITNVGIRYHDYRGILVNESELASIQTDLGPKAKVLFLRNHGVAIAAVSIAEAWYILKRIIAACQTQMRLMQLSGGANLLAELKENASQLLDGGNFNVPVSNGDDSANDKSNSLLANGENGENDHNSMWLPEELEFEAEMRVLDSAGFRTGHIYKQPNLLRRTHPGSVWTGDTIGDQLTAADLLTTDFSAAEFSTVEDIATAEAAGAQQVAKIVDHVRANKQKSLQRNQWLAKPNQTPNAKLVSSSMIVSPNGDKTDPGRNQPYPFDSPIGTPLNHPKYDSLRVNVPYSNGSGDHSFTCDDLTQHNANANNRSATLPAEVYKANKNNSNTMNSIDEVHIDGEGSLLKNKKVKKRSSFRMPSFSRKKKH